MKVSMHGTNRTWFSNVRILLTLSTILAVSGMVITVFITGGRNVYLYFISFILTSLYFKVLFTKLAFKISIHSDGFVQVVYYEKFRKKVLKSSIDDLKISLRKAQVTHVTRALTLEFINHKNEIICYASEEMLLWRTASLLEVQKVFNEMRLLKT